MTLAPSILDRLGPLLGQFVQVVDIPKNQIAALPNFDAAAVSVLADGEVVRMGINRN